MPYCIVVYGEILHAVEILCTVTNSIDRGMVPNAQNVHINGETAMSSN